MWVPGFDGQHCLFKIRKRKKKSGHWALERSSNPVLYHCDLSYVHCPGLHWYNMTRVTKGLSAASLIHIQGLMTSRWQPHVAAFQILPASSVLSWTPNSLATWPPSSLLHSKHQGGVDDQRGTSDGEHGWKEPYPPSWRKKGSYRKFRRVWVRDGTSQRHPGGFNSPHVDHIPWLFSVYFFAVVISEKVVSLCDSGWLQLEILPLPSAPSPLYILFLFTMSILGVWWWKYSKVDCKSMQIHRWVKTYPFNLMNTYLLMRITTTWDRSWKLAVRLLKWNQFERFLIIGIIVI